VFDVDSFFLKLLMLLLVVMDLAMITTFCWVAHSHWILILLLIFFLCACVLLGHVTSNTLTYEHIRRIR
jgi:hypothetical protein